MNAESKKRIAVLERELGDTQKRLCVAQSEKAEAIQKATDGYAMAGKYNGLAQNALMRNERLDGNAKRVGKMLIARRGELLAEVQRIEDLIEGLGFIQQPLYQRPE